MLIRHPRQCALLVGLALALTASPATASTVATDSAGSGQPSPSPTAQQQPASKQLSVRSPSPGSPGTGPYRPGDEVAFAVYVFNSGGSQEQFVITVTLPPELALISLASGDLAPLDCSGNVCRGAIAPFPGEADNARAVSLRARLSPSFRGTASTVRADLQEDANPDPSQRTTTTVLSVSPPAAGAAPAAPSSASGTGAGQTLPRTGDRTTVTALLALCMVLLGAIAQLMGTRRQTGSAG